MLMADPGSPKEKENRVSSAALLPDNTPLEFRVILSTCRVFLGTEEPTKLEALLQRGPEWELLLALSNRHGVMPLLYRSISQNCPQAVPSEWLARLRMQYMMNAARNVKMTAELLRILDALKEAGIKAVPLKGPVLAQQLYGDVSLRQFSDLDILVSIQDADKAMAVFEEKGYQVADDLRKEKSEKKRNALLKQYYHYELNNEHLRIHVELHWRLSPSFRRLNLDETAIWDRLKIIQFSNKEALSLSNKDYLVFLCQHGARHLWNRLSWICDLSALIIKDTGPVFALETAKDAKNERVLLLGLLLAQRLMNVTIPEEIIQGTKGERQLINLSDKIISAMISSEEDKNDSSQLAADLALYNNIFSFREKASFYANLFMTPTKPDFDLLPLPDVLFPAYRLVRPIRLLKDYGDAIKGQPKGQKKAD
jgi:hypothetical protein